MSCCPTPPTSRLITDYIAVRRLIGEHGLDPAATVLIRGSGDMANAVGAAFRDNGFGAGTIVARNAASGRELAERLGYEYAEDVGDRSASVIVNVTRSALPTRPRYFTLQSISLRPIGAHL